MIEAVFFNSSTKPIEVTVAFFVFSFDNKARTILQRDHLILTVNAGQRLAHVFEQEPVKRRVEEYRALGQTIISGQRPEGWAILARYSGNTNATASATHLRSLVTTPTELRPLEIAYNRQLAAQLRMEGFPVPPTLDLGDNPK
jgi:hypothetical protein